MVEMSDETIDRGEDVMLPGFRFHPTDEELVGFYLQRKIQNRPLPVELIKQVDIYKYEPWDLPKFAATGEKEWYFYCPRDRKYRNSARPNRVTGAGFWKATGTDRPIYSSDGNKCIGLKKSLVFYRGRAAKGIKTDWMMHEFRLPSLSDHHSPQPAPKSKHLLDKTLPANEAWAICRIFKKTSSMTQRALSHSWMSHFPEASPSREHHILTSPDQAFNSDNLSCTTASFSPQDPIASFKQPLFSVSNGQIPTNNYFMEASSQLLNSAVLEPHPMMNQFTSLAQEMLCRTENEVTERRKNDGVQPETIIRSIGFPFTLPDAWRHNNLPWDSPTCPSEMSTATYSPEKSYS